MYLFYLKSCNRCKTGDLVIEQDRFGYYAHCIQCGYYMDIDNHAYAMLVNNKYQSNKALPIAVSVALPLPVAMER